MVSGDVVVSGHLGHGVCSETDCWCGLALTVKGDHGRLWRAQAVHPWAHRAEPRARRAGARRPEPRPRAERGASAPQLTKASPKHHSHKHHPHNGHQKKTNGVAHSTSLPNIPTMKLVYEARRHTDADTKDSSSEAQSDVSAMRKNLRKRGVLAATSTNSSSATSLTTANSIESTGGHDRHGSVVDGVSSAKSLEYMLSKSAQVETLHQNDRRKAIARSTRKMAQLAVQTQSQAQLQSASESNETEAAKALFARTLAAMKGKKALLGLEKAASSLPENEAVIRGKKALAHTAKCSYERVADQSNRKLAEIEQHKARHHVEYFQSRYHTIFEDEQGVNGEKINQRHCDSDGDTNQRIDSRTATLLLPRIR